MNFLHLNSICILRWAIYLQHGMHWSTMAIATWLQARKVGLKSRGSSLRATSQKKKPQPNHRIKKKIPWIRSGRKFPRLQNVCFDLELYHTMMVFFFFLLSGLQDFPIVFCLFVHRQCQVKEAKGAKKSWYLFYA